MDPSTEPEPILLDWSPLSDVDQDGILSTTGTFTLADDAGYIDVTVHGKDPDALKEFTGNTRFHFYVQGEAPSVEASETPGTDAQQAAPEQAPPEDEDGSLSFEYIFRPREDVVDFSPPDQAPNIACNISNLSVPFNNYTYLYVRSAQAVSYTITVTKGVVLVSLWVGNTSTNSWMAIDQLKAPTLNGQKGFLFDAGWRLGLWGNNQTNKCNVTGSPWSTSTN